MNNRRTPQGCSQIPVEVHRVVLIGPVIDGKSVGRHRPVASKMEARGNIVWYVCTYNRHWDLSEQERLANLFARDTNQKCVLIVIADGFEEADAIVILSLLRQAGLCVKSVGLTSGLICSVHGVLVMPDLTLADLECLTEAPPIGMVILSEGSHSLSRLEADPRVHRLLRQVVAQRGQIVTSAEGLRVPRAAAIWESELEQADDDQRMPVLLRKPGQSPEALALNLIRRLKHPPLV